jgi:predicted permease
MDGVVINFNNIGLNYFKTMGIPLIKGRDFGPQDSGKASPTVIINETAARLYWPDQDPIGKRVRLGTGGPFAEVVGVAKDGKYITLGEDPIPFLYLPMLRFYQPSAVLQVRTTGDPNQMITAVQSEIKGLDDDLPVYGVMTMNQYFHDAMIGPRIAAVVLSVFGAIAMLLASIGLYGVMAYTVSRRTREIGIRIALGAKPADILIMVLRQGMALVMIGVVIGLAAALAVTRLLSGFLYSVSATDPLTFISITLLLAGVALIASYIPARRATKVDPMVALRYE